MGNLSKDYSSGDFECSCGCGESNMNKKFVDKLQTLKTIMAIDLPVVKGSSFSCGKSDKKPKKSKLYDSEDSDKKPEKIETKNDNTTGRVTEIKIKSSELFKTMNVAMGLGFTGIGIKDKNGSVQLHLDDLVESTGNQPRPYIWTS